MCATPPSALCYVNPSSYWSGLVGHIGEMWNTKIQLLKLRNDRTYFRSFKFELTKYALGLLRVA